jgi:hypothetical protein
MGAVAMNPLRFHPQFRYQTIQVRVALVVVVVVVVAKPVGAQVERRAAFLLVSTQARILLQTIPCRLRMFPVNKSLDTAPFPALS